MNKTIVLHLGDQPEELSARDYADTQVIEQPDARPMTYYTAQTSNGDIVGTVQINPNDRKATGALVGGWIAAGLQIDCKTYKELNKVLREQQKALDAIEAAAKAIATAATTTAGEAPASVPAAAPASASAPAVNEAHAASAPVVGTGQVPEKAF